MRPITKNQLRQVIAEFKPNITEDEFDIMWDEFQECNVNHYLTLSNDIINLTPTTNSQGIIQ
jgi:hypothetical protein